MKSKKTTVILLLICVLLLQLTTFAACGNDLPNNSDGVDITLIVLDLDSNELYEQQITTNKSTLYEVLNEFEGIEVNTTSSFLGAFITAVAIGTIKENEFGKYFSQEYKIESGYSAQGYLYIGVYHDIDLIELKDLNPYAADLIYGGKTYFYSGVGVSALPLYAGATYILKLTASS